MNPYLSISAAGEVLLCDGEPESEGGGVQVRPAAVVDRVPHQLLTRRGPPVHKPGDAIGHVFLWNQGKFS